MSAARTQVYFTAEQRRRLDAIAERDDKSLAQVVRDAVDAYLDDRPSGAAVNDALDHARERSARLRSLTSRNGPSGRTGHGL